jgi:uncharacterized protein
MLRRLRSVGSASPRANFGQVFDQDQNILMVAALNGVTQQQRNDCQMTHTPHDLHAEFPDDGSALHSLKLNDVHFRGRAGRYHDINREIHRIEVGVEAASDARVEDLKKTRLTLLDEIADMIAATKSVMT